MRLDQFKAKHDSTEILVSSLENILNENKKNINLNENLINDNRTEII